MSLSPPKLVFGVVVIFALTAGSLFAQDSTTTLSGTVVDSSGKALADVKVSAKNLNINQTYESRTDASGGYSFVDLATGEYEVSAGGDALGSAAARVTLTAGTPQTVDLTLRQEGGAPAGTPPNAPSASKTEPSLEDLGFSAADTNPISFPPKLDQRDSTTKTDFTG